MEQENSNRKQDGAPIRVGNDNDDNLRQYDNHAGNEETNTKNRTRVSINEISYSNYRKYRSQDEKRKKFFSLYQELNPNAPVFQPIEEEARRRSFEPDEKRQRNNEQDKSDDEILQFLNNMMTNIETIAETTREERRVAEERLREERRVQEQKFDETIEAQKKLLRKKMAQLIVNRHSNSKITDEERTIEEEAARNRAMNSLSNSTQSIKPVENRQDGDAKTMTGKSIKENRIQQEYEDELWERYDSINLRQRVREDERRRDEEERRRQDEEDHRQITYKQLVNVPVEPESHTNRGTDPYSHQGNWQQKGNFQDDRRSQSQEVHRSRMMEWNARSRSNSLRERNPKQILQNLKFGKFPTLLKADGDYLLFTDRVRSELKAKGFLHVVDKKINPPNDWMKQELNELDAAVRNFIASNVEDKVYRQARMAITSIDLSSRLGQIIDPSGSATIYGLHERFGVLRYNPNNESALQFNNRFDEITERIRRRESLDDAYVKRNYLFAIQNAVPSAMAQEKAEFGRNKRGMTLEELKDAVLDDKRDRKEETRRQKVDEKSYGSGAANYGAGTD